MTPEQIARLLDLLERIANKQYTITGAADWPILVAVGGVLLTIIGAMWLDLRSTIKEHRKEWKEQLREHTTEQGKAIDLLWEAHRECQDDCCPRGRGKG